MPRSSDVRTWLRYKGCTVERFTRKGAAGTERPTWFLTNFHTGEKRPERAVLIVHGANSGSVTFAVPDGGFARYLAEEGWDVWLLDWRGSPAVVEPLLEQPLRGTPMEEIRAFTMDEAANDVAEAVEEVRRRIKESTPLSLIGHCVGGGITSIAIASGLLESPGHRVDSVVLTALGLFCEVPWDGWIKAEDFILERVLASTKPCRAIDPHAKRPWPDEMSTAFELWPKAWQVKPPGGGLLNRLTFMVGRPWFPECIDERIDEEALDAIFGSLHLGLYIHCGQMVRRGYAAEFDAPDVIDRSRLAGGQRRRAPKSYLLPQPFRNRKVTLVAAAKNRVWHRDSMDLMYEWLLNEARGPASRFEKLVFPNYGLQEIYWATDATTVAYPRLAAALSS